MPAKEGLLVLCATLVRRKDRRFVLEESLTLPDGAALTFFDAVDDTCIPTWRLARYPEGTSRTDYASRLTLRLALRKFLRSGSARLLYLNDDVVKIEEWDFPADEDFDLSILGGGEALLFSRKGARMALTILRQWNSVSWEDELTENLRIHRPKNPVTTTRTELHQPTPGLPRPFMQIDDLAVLDAALNSASRVLEYGCGGSTFHIAERLKGRGELLSIEHNRKWFDTLTALLSGRDLPAKVILREPKPQRDQDGPWRFLPGQLADYIPSPLEFYDEDSVDLVLIDGRERMACVGISRRLLKKGGLMMIHDFWPRHRYRVHLSIILKDFDYLFESPPHPGNGEQGMAVFRLR